MVYNPKYALFYPPVSLFTGVFIYTYIIYNESVLLFFKSMFCVIITLFRIYILPTNFSKKDDCIGNEKASRNL